MKRTRIFISSTFIDLIPHRKAIWDLLSGLNVDVVGMEKFGSRNDKPLETCIDEVKSANIFILVLGMRYGTIDEISGKSYTQLEYEKAKKLNLEILPFIINESEARISPSIIDFDNIKLLDQFKKLTKENHTIEYFINEIDLIMKLDSSLKRILSEGDYIKYYRPEKIPSELYQTKIENENYNLILGLKNGIPIELYISKNEGIFTFFDTNISEKYILKGKNEFGNITYDFEYIDNDGYKTTIIGINQVHSNLFIAIISKMLEKEVEIDKISDIIHDINFELDFSEKEIKKFVIDVLQKNNNS